MSEWISVNDDLPDEQGEYLITGDDLTEVDLGAYTWAHPWYSFAGLIKDVTHWMPLSPPPQD